MKKLRFRIIGESPLVMHNGRLADPLDSISRKMKEVSSKRKKVDADHEELARLEWHGGLYLDEGRPCIPAENLEAALSGKGGAARKEKMGKQAEAAMFLPGNALLEYEGPTDIDKLWADERFRLRVKVKVQANAVMRTRPIFREWAASFDVAFDADLVNEEDVGRWVKVAGEVVGIGDWRPRFGRFRVESVELV